MTKLIQPLLLLLTLAALGACSTQTVKSTTVTPLVSSNTAILETELLDVGIGIFDPGLEEIQANREELTFADVRIAETQYVAFLLAQTLQSNGDWGVVRVIPHDLSATDLAVRGMILQSDGETENSTLLRFNDSINKATLCCKIRISKGVVILCY